jgi:phosphopantetheine adenylyltransferase
LQRDICCPTLSKLSVIIDTNSETYQSFEKLLEHRKEVGIVELAINFIQDQVMSAEKVQMLLKSKK